MFDKCSLASDTEVKRPLAMLSLRPAALCFQCTWQSQLLNHQGQVENQQEALCMLHTQSQDLAQEHRWYLEKRREAAFFFNSFLAYSPRRTWLAPSANKWMTWSFSQVFTLTVLTTMSHHKEMLASFRISTNNPTSKGSEWIAPPTAAHMTCIASKTYQDDNAVLMTVTGDVSISTLQCSPQAK